MSEKPSSVRVIYSNRYDISFFGIERLHPFDSRKYSRAWTLLRNEFGAALSQHHIAVDRQVTDEELLLVHSRDYLNSLKSAAVIASALEVPILSFLPAWMLHWRILGPMRWAVRGSVLAAKAALDCGLAVNLSGGYHHAKPSTGEGFCVYSDIALIVRQLRKEKSIAMDAAILYIDLDAHQGNGVCHQFLSDDLVSIFDMYNRDIYPAQDSEARKRVDCSLPLSFGCLGAEYLSRLRERLPQFLDTIESIPGPALAIYNAGTDVFAGDKLGGLGLSAKDILDRDIFVIQELERRQIPTVMLLSGGYSQESHQFVAATVRHLLLNHAH